MYHLVAAFDVLPEKHTEFLAAALKNGRDSRANEPGTKRFEVIKDEESGQDHTFIQRNNSSTLCAAMGSSRSPGRKNSPPKRATFS